MFCSSVVNLFLGHVRLEHFVKHIHFSLEKSRIYEFLAKKRPFFKFYRNRSALIVGKFDDKLGSGSFLGVIERPEAAHNPNRVLGGQFFLPGIFAPWFSRIGHFVRLHFSHNSHLKRGSRFRGFYKGSFRSPPYSRLFPSQTNQNSLFTKFLLKPSILFSKTPNS